MNISAYWRYNSRLRKFTFCEGSRIFALLTIHPFPISMGNNIANKSKHVIIPEKILQTDSRYVILQIQRKSNRPQGVDQMNMIVKPPFHSPKYQGGFCYVVLLTKRKHISCICTAARTINIIITFYNGSHETEQ